MRQAIKSWEQIEPGQRSCGYWIARPSLLHKREDFSDFSKEQVDISLFQGVQSLRSGTRRDEDDCAG